MRSSPSVTICCTFNGALDRVASDVGAFLDLGATVRSPSDPTLAEVTNGFLFVASDNYRDRTLVERRHLEAIAASDLVWLIAPDGYVGFSAGAEIAFAAGRGVPVFTADRVNEPVVDALAVRVPSIAVALARCDVRASRVVPALLEPERLATTVAGALDCLDTALRSRSADPALSKFTSAMASNIRSALVGL